MKKFKGAIQRRYLYPHYGEKKISSVCEGWEKIYEI